MIVFFKAKARELQQYGKKTKWFQKTSAKQEWHTLYAKKLLKNHYPQTLYFHACNYKHACVFMHMCMDESMVTVISILIRQK